MFSIPAIYIVVILSGNIWLVHGPAAVAMALATAAG